MYFFGKLYCAVTLMNFEDLLVFSSFRHTVVKYSIFVQ